MRYVVLLVVVGAAVVAMLWARPFDSLPLTPRRPAAGAIESPRFTYVTTARQLGIVGYRDPYGAISPDGTRIAYAEGRFIRVVPIGGGAPITLAPGEGQIRYLTWSANDTIVAEDATPAARWWIYRVGTDERAPLWSGRPIDVGSLRQVAWSLDGKSAAALSTTKEGSEVWRIAADGGTAEHKRVEGRASFPAFTSNGDIACILDRDGRARVSIPCGADPIVSDPDVNAIGPLAFSRDGAEAYFASPNASKDMVELWTLNISTRRARRLTAFARDAYAPSIAATGAMIFKVQTYRTFVADAPAAGGATRQVTAFQAETPSWHPTEPRLSFTYGTWRRVVDDAKYPDIAQDIGTIDLGARLPAAAPSAVIARSDSEDQAMSWSPNGKWIAFHTHREMSDDVWLRPADGSQPDKRITFLGRGAEVGWPRWSPDGNTVLLDGARKADGRSVIYTIGVDQANGELTSELREVKAEGFDGDITHAEWLPNGTGVIAIAKEAPGRHAIITLPLAGGRASIVHRFATEHDFPGLGIAPDGKQVAFTAPATDGYFQIFRMPLAGGEPVQVTADPSNKSQPAWSPDGTRIAFTVWSYEAAFWSMR